MRCEPRLLQRGFDGRLKVFGRTADGAVEEHDLDTGAAELLHEQHLIGIAPR